MFPLDLSAEGLSGQIIDNQNQPLANVHVLVYGSSLGSTSDSSGTFVFEELPWGEHVLEFSSMGYANQWMRINFPSDDKLSITLEPTIIQLSAITVSGTMVTNISTPVTHSSLNSLEISRQHVVQDIPTLLASEPGIYVTNDGGSGFGDSQIMIRGFDEKRLQVLVNNIPVNDPETKEVSWSSWSALPEATQAIQVQRGVGTSLYGTGAIGGAINIVTLDSNPLKSTQARLALGQFGVRKLSFSHNSGTLKHQRSFLINLGYLEGSGWRDNSYYRGIQYYMAFTQRVGVEHLFKAILHGSPQYHTLAKASLTAASYARPDQFSHDSLRLDGWGYPAYGFGSSFNGNVHVAESDIAEVDLQNQTTLVDAIFMRSQIGASPSNQVGGFTVAGDRASLNSNISHRPQFELHHNWYFNPKTRLTTTAFITRGLDYSDDVYPAWFIPRTTNGSYDYNTISTGSYWFSEQVFAYRYYSDFTQIGLLSSFSTKYGQHDLLFGLESRRWSARHAGEVLNTFGQENVGVPIGSVIHPLQESALFYDFTTTKPQTTVFGHALWHFGQFQIMTNIQYSRIHFRVKEQVPSNNNYPTYLDPGAIATHGGSLWEGTATWDHDNDSLTGESPVQYSLWDYSKGFQYVTPRLGLSYRVSQQISTYANYSIGVKEPEIKHFYGYGAPQNELELERTNDLELGLSYNSSQAKVPISLGLTYYNIDFAGKLMQITLPEKANTPGYDYAGHTFVPVGNARYTGVELSGSLQLPGALGYTFSLSQSKNTWGEPDGIAGAQKLYENVAIANQDYDDANDNGYWDEGGQEQALHGKFIEKFGARYDVGMPQFIWNQALGYSGQHFSGTISTRYFRDLYILENNDPVLIGGGPDGLYFTSDDEYSAALPIAFITNINITYSTILGSHEMKAKLHIRNAFNEKYWQRGDVFGVIPGGVRTWIMGLDYQL